MEDTSLSETRERAQHLPPPRTKPALADHLTHPPLYKTPLRKVINYITIGVVLLSIFYAWRITQWKSNSGGWVNLLLGRHPSEPLPKPGSSSGDAGPASIGLENRIRDLADELGIHPRELASAIKPLLPTASVSSIASSHPTPSGSVVGVLASEGDAAAEGAKAVKIGLGSIVGLDEPVDFDD